MKSKLILCATVCGTLFALSGCGSDQKDMSPDQKKAFLGAPMPKGFMEEQQKQMKAAQEAAQKAAADAAAAHGGGK